MLWDSIIHEMYSPYINKQKVNITFWKSPKIIFQWI